MDPAALAALAHVHAHGEYLTVRGEQLFVPQKAYKDTTWLNSHGAKPLRFLAELMEPEQRFAAAGVKNTILVFGSARSRSPEDHAAAVKKEEAVLADESASAEAKKKATDGLARLAKTAWMVPVYTQVQELSRRLTEWSMSRTGQGPYGGGAPYIISTGGGPGLMEAANRGAAEVPGAISAGIAISLPFEHGVNKYVTQELSFMSHYFCTRKLHLVGPARALIVTAGGFGSCDELFEVLTLMQTGKIEHPDVLPVVLFPGSYWKRCLNWQEFVDAGVVAPADVDQLKFTDDVDDAFSFVTGKLLAWEARAKAAQAAAAEAAAKFAISARTASHIAYLEAHKAACASLSPDGSPVPNDPSVLAAAAAAAAEAAAAALAKAQAAAAAAAAALVPPGSPRSASGGMSLRVPVRMPEADSHLLTPTPGAGTGHGAGVPHMILASSKSTGFAAAPAAAPAAAAGGAGAGTGETISPAAGSGPTPSSADSGDATGIDDVAESAEDAAAAAVADAASKAMEAYQAVLAPNKLKKPAPSE